MVREAVGLVRVYWYLIVEVRKSKEPAFLFSKRIKVLCPKQITQNKAIDSTWINESTRISLVPIPILVSAHLIALRINSSP